MKYRYWLIIFLMLIVVFGTGGRRPTPTNPVQVTGQVLFSSEQVASSNAGQEDTSALITTITTSWEAYLQQNVAQYTELLAPDITRMSTRAGKLQQGREIVAAELPREWEAFERPQGVISEKMTLKQAEITVDKNPSATVATVLYWVNIVGGTRWKYDDQGLIFQAFARINGTWKITHQIDSWSLDYKIGQQKPGQETFEFDFVHPVANLERAIQFYQPILGEPEAVTSNRASFNLEGPRFILDGERLDGLAKVQRELPNGYAIFYVKDVIAERDRLKKLGVPFLNGTATAIKSLGEDKYVIGMDPSGNPFVLMQREYASLERTQAPQVKKFAQEGPYAVAVEALATSWMKTDLTSLGRFLGTNSTWFDDTRTKIRGIERGKDAILTALPSIYWAKFDRSPNGLKAKLEISSLHIRSVGVQTIVSYVMSLIGTGAHAFRDISFVTHVFQGPSTVVNTFIVGNNSPRAMVMELDYTGYPVTNLAKAEDFYTNTLRLGDPYTDSQYRGYWSNQSVFGIYSAKPVRDGLPRPNQTNGYVSFWIHSAQQTYEYLKKQESTFPIIPAINTLSGIDPQPGYTQIYATDSEGNGVIFTEYSGKRK